MSLNPLQLCSPPEFSINHEAGRVNVKAHAHIILNEHTCVHYMNVPLFRKALIPLPCPHKHPLSVGTKSINKPVLKTYSAKRHKTVFGSDSSALRQRSKDCVRCCRGVCSTGFNGLVGWQWLWVICKVNGIQVGAGARFAEFDGFSWGKRSG